MDTREGVPYVLIQQAQEKLWQWLDETGIIPRRVSHEAELESIVSDAVIIGYKARCQHIEGLEKENKELKQSCLEFAKLHDALEKENKRLSLERRG